MNKRKKTYKLISWGIGLLLLFTTIGFVEKKQDSRTCSHIDIHIQDQQENYFVSQQDITRLITMGGEDQVTGKPLGALNLKALETRVEEHKFIRHAEVYHDLKGNLIVKAWQNQPIARIIRPTKPDAYVSTTGEILPVSESFTADVPLVSGAYADTLVERQPYTYSRGRQLLAMLQLINESPFWQAQIAQLEMDARGHITLYTNISKQRVEFGSARNHEKKFRKLKLFYTEILPAKGWNTYSRVNLEYHDQIICE